MDEIKNKFNWGACLLTWIWGLGNNTYITLLYLLGLIFTTIPIVGWLIPLALHIWFGTKGNEWAWENKKFDTVEKFNKYQKKWAIAGIIFSVIFFIVILLFFIFAIGIVASLSSEMIN